MDDDYELVGVNQVARLLRIEPKIVRLVLSRGRIHPPVLRGPPPQWDREEIEAWARRTGYWPDGLVRAAGGGPAAGQLKRQNSRKP